MEVGFRRLTEDDLPMLHRWLNEPGVVRWWEGDDVSWEAVVRDYGSANPDPAEHWIASLKGEPLGWIQCYAAADEPEETEPWWALGIERAAAGIDYLVGDPADRRRGLGSAMIAAFVAEVVFALHPGWTQACAAPFEANVASWRALEKAGFRFAGIVEDAEGPCRLMVADRPGSRRPPSAGHAGGGRPPVRALGAVSGASDPPAGKGWAWSRREPRSSLLPRRRFLLGVSVVPSVLLACGRGEPASRGGTPAREVPVAERHGDGRLGARPDPAEMAPGGPEGVQRLELAQGGTALVYVPAGSGSGRLSPLAVMLHGAGGSAEDGLALLRPLADEAGLILLAPASRGRTWDLLLDGFGPDVALIDEALGRVFDRYPIDPARLAVGGFSDGASYALSLGTRNGELFSHVVAFSPGFWSRGDGQGSPSFFVTHGTDDRVLPIASTSRRLVPMLERAGYEVIYREFDGPHVVPGDLAAEAVVWFLGEG